MKKWERVSSSFLQSARQIQSFATLEAMKKNHNAVDKQEKPENNLSCPFTCPKAMEDLEAASGVVQHHDGVSGTSKQHVAYDYAKMLAKGVNNALSTTLNALSYLMNPGSVPIDGETTYLHYCQLLNETSCDASIQLSKNADKSPMQVVLWNSLAHSRSFPLRIPVMENAPYTVFNNKGEVVPSAIIESNWSPNTNASPYTLSFVATDLAPLDYTTYTIKKGKAQDQIVDSLSSSLTKTARRSLISKNALIAESDTLRVEFDKSSGRMTSITRKDSGMSMALSQDYYFYNAFVGEPQNDGAYIFRPDAEHVAWRLGEDKIAIDIIEHENVVTEIHQSWSSWVNQTIRLWHGSSEMEIEYSVGPVPLDDNHKGKNVISRFTSGVNNYEDIYTDSNGREFQQRILNYRPTYDLDVNEPVAGNYYPMNAAAYIKDDKKQLSLVTDRSQGVASLHSGEMEVMVQRRGLVDDSRGVGEPLNETTGGIVHEESSLDYRVGDGVVIRGMHSLLFGKADEAIVDVRTKMDETFFQPVIAFTEFRSSSTEKNSRKPSMVSDKSLPPSVSLITFKSLTCDKESTGSGKQFLLRLANQYAIDEKPAAKTETVNLVDYFENAGYKLTDIKEMTLAGNKALASLKRLTWKVDDGSTIGGDYNDEELVARKEYVDIKDGSDIKLTPMDIRTFIVTLSS